MRPMQQRRDEGHFGGRDALTIIGFYALLVQNLPRSRAGKSLAAKGSPRSAKLKA